MLGSKKLVAEAGVELTPFPPNKTTSRLQSAAESAALLLSDGPLGPDLSLLFNEWIELCPVPLSAGDVGRISEAVLAANRSNTES